MRVILMCAAGFTALTVMPGCSNVRERDTAYCRSLGLTDGNQLAQCVAQQDQSRTQRSLAAMQAGSQMIQASQPRAVTTTTCNRVGNQLVCTSM